MSLATLIADAVGLRKHRGPAKTERGCAFPDVSAAPLDSRRLIRDRRYCCVLTSQHDMPFDEVSISCAWKALEHEMALVPGGSVCLHSETAVATAAGLELIPNEQQPVTVESLYIDRHCVTNADYARFVQAGGYSEPRHWPVEVLPNVLQFTDRSGHPGPCGWSDGQPPADLLNHPVVGISWYEANAYANWVGKRLPASQEWQRAGTWPQGHSANGAEIRYPWGNAFDPSKANTWASNLRGTVEVDQFSTGSTPNGVRQLIGNVWEWVDAQYAPHAEEGIDVHLDGTIAETRGGAFDSYFHSQATCQFRTGQPMLFRGANVGFRCCLSADALPQRADESISHEPPTEQ